MARHDDRQRIGRAGRADRADRGRPACPGRQLPIRDGRPVGDARQQQLHGPPESAGGGQIQGQLEAATDAGEVLVELAGRLVQSAGGAQDPWTDGGCERCQHLVVTLTGEGDPGQAAVAGDQQQGAEG